MDPLLLQIRAMGDTQKAVPVQSPAAAAPEVIVEDCGRFIGNFVNFCDRCSIDLTKDTGGALKAAICLCMKFIDKRVLLNRVLPDFYVDWEFVDMNMDSTAKSHGPVMHKASRPDPAKLSGNLIGDVTVWMQMIQFVDFGPLDMNEMLVKTKYPPLWCIYKTLKDSGVLPTESLSRHANHEAINKGKTLRFDDACKLCLLNNVIGLQSRTVIDHFTGARLGKDSFAVCTHILSALADERHESDVYMATICHLLSIAKIHMFALSRQIYHFRQTMEARKMTWRLKHMAVQHSRPSMRDVALRVAGRSESSTTMGSSIYNDSMSDITSITGGGAAGASAITFESFCEAVRFPNSMSRLLRVRCYLICSLEHAFEYRKHTEKLVTKDVASALNRNPVVIPDVLSLGAAIDTLALHGEPFSELNSFRQRCFVSFAVRNRRNLTMTMALQLYVAAYQKRDIWRYAMPRRRIRARVYRALLTQQKMTLSGNAGKTSTPS